MKTVIALALIGMVFVFGLIALSVLVNLSQRENVSQQEYKTVMLNGSNNVWHYDNGIKEEIMLNGSNNTLYCDSFDIVRENGINNKIIRR